MAAKWLLNNVTLTRGLVTAGSSIEDTDQDEVETAGGVLIDKGDSTVDDAAAECERQKLRGVPSAQLESLMQSAVSKKQGSDINDVNGDIPTSAESATATNQDTTATNQAATATNQNAVLSSLVCFPGPCLPAPGVSMHAQIAGGSALNVLGGLTSPLPARNAVITRSDAGPATVDYTLTWQLPDGTNTTTEIVTVPKNGSAAGVKAGKLIGVSTDVDPVSTTDIATGNRVSVGSSIGGVPVISIDGVRENLGGSTDGTTGTVQPTTTLDGVKVLSVLYLALHTHTQDSHNHLQDAHGHTQDAHTHTLA